MCGKIMLLTPVAVVPETISSWFVATKTRRGGRVIFNEDL